MPKSILIGLGAIGVGAMTQVERALSFLNTGLFGNLILVGLNRARKKPQPPGFSTVVNSTFSVRQPISPWQVVIGQRRVGGTITFIFLATDKKYLHMVVTLACHVSEEIGDLWFDDEVITPAMLDGSGVVTSGKFSRIVPTPRQETYTVTGGVVTTAHPIASVQAVIDSPDTEHPLPLIDVSPSTPGTNEFKWSGSTITFNASQEGREVRVDYTEGVVEPVCRIKKSLGGEAGQPFADLVSESEGKWVDTDRQTGHTKIYIRFDTSLLQGNAPSISAVVKGAKLYDPRTTLTTWSANPALGVLYYLMNTEFGFGVPLAKIGTTEFNAAANVCEERVALSGSATTTFTADASTDAITLATGSQRLDIGDGVRVSSSGTLPAGLAAATTYYAFYASGLLKLASSFANALAGTPINITDAGSGTHTLTYFDEQRYTANGAFLTSERRVDVLQDLLSAMGGSTAMLTRISSTWRVFAGAYEAATLTLTDKDFAGPIQIEPMQPREKWANGAKGVFVNPSSNWQPTDFPAIAPTSPYLAEDGGEAMYADFDFTKFVTSSGQSQRLARIEVRQARSGLVVTAQFKLTAWRSFTGHSVALTFAKYGWSAKEFTIVQSGFVVIDGDGGPALGVQLTLRETNSTIFSWSAEEQAQGTPPSTSLPNPFSVPAPGAPTVVETLYETSGSAGLKSRATVSWTAVVDPLVKSYEVAWKNAADPEYQIVPVPNGTALDVDDLEAGLFLFAVRAFNGIARSAWSPYTQKTLLGLTAPPSDPTGFSVIASNGFAVARWDLAPDLDVRIGGRAIVRFSPLTSGATWEDGILISGTVDLPGFPGDTIMSPPLPLKSGTYLLKFRDSSGNYSATEASFVATEGMVTGFTTLTTITEDASFSGTKTDVVVNGSNLQLASVNLLQRTEELDNAIWSKTHTSVSANATTAPDGTATADKVVEDATNNAHAVSQSTTKATAAIEYTLSVYVKPGGRDRVTLQMQDGVDTWATSTFNVATGVITAVGPGTSSIAAAANGFYRCSVTGTSTTTTTILSIVYLHNGVSEIYTGDGTSGAFVWGAQTEVAAQASAYDKLVGDRIGSVINPTGSYAFNATDDRGSIAVRRFEATLKATSFDTGDTIDSRTDNIDTWDSIDGGVVNDCNIQMLASVSDDNVTYKPFTPFYVGDFSGRYSKFRADFTSGSPNHNIAASQIRVAIKVP